MKKKILIITTGGTIAMKHNSPFGVIPNDEFAKQLCSLPQLEEIAVINVFEFSNIPSPYIDPNIMLELAKIIDKKIKGTTEIVILDTKKGQLLAFSSQSSQQDTIPLSNYSVGTALTPIYYLTAFVQGYSPASLLWDIPEEDNHISNPDETYHGPICLRIALANDYIVPLEGIIQQIGLQNILNTTREVGINFVNIQPTGINNLFEAKVNLLDLTKAYSVLANQGILAGKRLNNKSAFTTSQIQPTALIKVTDSKGNELLNWETPDSKPIFSSQLTYLITDILKDRTARWPSLGHPNPLEVDRPAAVKSSTSIDGKTSWTIGYLPQVAIGVLYNSQDASPYRNNIANNLWHVVTTVTSHEIPYADFSKPDGIVKVKVCDPSGLLPTKDCPNTVFEVFIEGNQPTQSDTLYTSIPINKETGNRANIYTPPYLIEDKIYMNIPKNALSWAVSEGIELPPNTFDIIPETEDDYEAIISSPDEFDVIHETVQIIGSANSDDFSYYRIQIGQGLYPTSWFQIGEDITHPAKNVPLMKWDTSNMNGLYTIQLLVVDKNHTVHRYARYVTVDNEPPEITFILPKDNDQLILKENRKITIQADIKDNHKLKVAKFFIDDKTIATLTDNPLIIFWNPTIGSHQLRIIAEDTAGNSIDKSIQFTISIK